MNGPLYTETEMALLHILEVSEKLPIDASRIRNAAFVALGKPSKECLRDMKRDMQDQQSWKDLVDSGGICDTP